ncbi:MAG: sigma-70 family RNA polymerase sigma factor [Phycisphaerales bacterium]|nr:sigma-70 family RNA polymerase sigma factor [Phycisphaerales bacterium]
MQRDAFEKLALEHLDGVHRMAVHLAQNEAEAADLVQETYLKAIRAADGFEERGGGMRPWLFRILQNVFFSSRKAAALRKGAPLLDDPPSSDPEVSPAWDLATLDWEQVDDRLKHAIEDLRPDYRMVLLLWAVEGLRYRDIAEVMEVPIGTVMRRIHQARTILIAQLAEWSEEHRLPGRS